MFRLLIDNNSTQDWVYALFAVVSMMAMLFILRSIVLKYLIRISKTTDTVIDDFLVDVLSSTRILLASALALYVATYFLTLPPALGIVADRAFVGLLLLQCGFWTNRGLVFWLRNRFSQGDEGDVGSRAMTLSLLTFLGRVVLWALVALLILDNLGLNVTALVASLGIGGIAIALAVQNILGDLFASLSIAIDKPFVIGDFIIVGEHMGSVEHVGLKTTRVRSLSGEQIIFSNNDLLKSRVRNYKRMQERRALFAIGVTYDTPAEQLEVIPGLIEKAIKGQENARFDRAHFKGFGSSSLDFEAVYYVLKPDYGVFMDIQQAINLKLVRDFNERKIAFAFPTQTLHVSGGLQMTPPTSAEIADSSAETKAV